MNGEIREAFDIFNERKAPLIEGQSAMVGDDVARLMLSGLDLDLEEIQGLKRQIASSFVMAVEEGGCHPLESAFGLWVDGLATGLILAERRARAEATDG